MSRRLGPENSGIKEVDRMTQLPGQLTRNDLSLNQQRGDLRLLQASLDLKDKEIQVIKLVFFLLLR